MSAFSKIYSILITFIFLVSAPLPVSAQATQATNFTLRNINGKYVRLSDYNQQVVVLSFWATWCKPCLAELQHLQKFYQKYKTKGLVVLAVSMDNPETQANVRLMVQRHQWTFPVVIDQETRIVKLFNPKHAAPFTVILRKGKMVKTREGFQVSDLPAIEKDIEAQLR